MAARRPNYYGMATTGEDNPGSNGALFQRSEGSGITLTMSVDSIEDAEAKITGEGGTVVQSKQATPGMGRFSTYKDTVGNGRTGRWCALGAQI